MRNATGKSEPVFHRREKLVRRELLARAQVPYTAHMSEHVVRTRWGDYVQVFKLAGASFESADDEQLNTWHERLSVALRNIASPNLALWTHIVRRRERSYPAGSFEIAFADQLNSRYRDRISGERLMCNDLYLSTVYRSTTGVLTNWTSKILSRAHRSAMDLDIQAALESCEKLRQTLLASLERYDIEPLGLYDRSGIPHSQVLEFFGVLLNGESQPCPLPRAPLNETLTTSRPVFGVESIEYRMPSSTQLGAMLGIAEYPASTVTGMFDSLLSAPFPFVLTQSFTFLSKASGQGLLARQSARMSNAGDLAISQAALLKDALDGLAGDEFVMGDHHFSLLVQTDSFPRYDEREVIAQQKILNDRVSVARRMLTDCNMRVAREDIALEAAYWGQFPGCFARRLRKAPITSRNFASMSPGHNFPTGRARDNHWGDALTLLITSARSPFFFSLHASDPKDNDSRRDVGHTFICGPTGAGKTVFIGFLITMLTKFGCTQVLIDKDRGLEILIRVLGGEYLPLKNGVPTGCNPLQLPATPGNLDFLKSWIRLLAQSAGEASTVLPVREEADLDIALRGTMALDLEERRLSRLIEFLDPTRSDGLYARLSKWCYVTAGDMAWAFDCEEDLIVPRFNANSILGFDLTDQINHPTVRTPIISYLLHLVGQLLGTRRLVVWLEEFQAFLSNPALAGFADSSLPVYRKLDGVMNMATQSPGKVLENPISRTVLEQIPTKVYFPNAHATRKDYREGFGLTEREYRLVKEQMDPGSRRFLIKQDRHSVVCALDLKGFAEELAVISGRSSSVRLVEELIEHFGPEPEDWLPHFYEALLAHPSDPSTPSEGDLS